MPADTAMAGRSLAMAGRSKFETMTEFSKFKGPKQKEPCFTGVFGVLNINKFEF
jgi:hypothetical protein